jgi:hypothetical protein
MLFIGLMINFQVLYLPKIAENSGIVFLQKRKRGYTSKDAYGTKSDTD